MELSTFATITGIFELIIGIPLIVAGLATNKFIQKVLSNEVTMRIMGAVITVICALVLLDGATIGTDPEGLIRLVAWIGFIKGISAAWRPDILVGISQSFLKQEFLLLAGIVGTAIGVLLLYGAALV